MNFQPIAKIEEYRQRRQLRQLESEIQLRISEARFAAMNLMTATGELQENVYKLLGKSAKPPSRPLSDGTLLAIYLLLIVVIISGFSWVQIHGK